MKSSTLKKLSYCFIKGLSVVFLLIAYHSSYALPVNIVDLQTLLSNLSKTIPNLMQLTTAIAYVMGMVFIIRALMGLKEHADHRSSGGKGGLKGSLILLAVGTALLYLPSSVQSGLTTFWTDPAPFSYITDASNDQWASFINSVFLISQLIGTIAFIRGLVILSHIGESHQQAGFGKAMAHIVGGILLINLYQFLQAIFVSLGLGQI